MANARVQYVSCVLRNDLSTHGSSISKLVSRGIAEHHGRRKAALRDQADTRGVIKRVRRDPLQDELGTSHLPRSHKTPKPPPRGPNYAVRGAHGFGAWDKGWASQN